MYIHETHDWPNFTWNKELIDNKLIKLSKAVGDCLLLDLMYSSRQQ